MFKSCSIVTSRWRIGAICRWNASPVTSAVVLTAYDFDAINAISERFSAIWALPSWR